MLKNKTNYTLDQFDINSVGWNPSNNPEIVETAGFVPLEVKFKQFEANGIRAQFREDEFTSSEMRDLYLNPAFEFNQYDDLETILQKTEAQEAFKRQLLAQKKTSDVSSDSETKKETIVEKPVVNSQDGANK